VKNLKILIIGAGPTGLSAAINASKNGNEALVFEKNEVAGSKVCGEALAKEALNYVNVKPSKKFIVSEVKGFRITFKGKFIRKASFGNLTSTPGYLIDKPSFLSALQDEAEKNGAKIFFNSKVGEIDPKNGKIKLQNGDIVKGNLIICADGSGSAARNHLDYSNYEVATGVQYKCSLPEGLDPDYLHLDIIGEGYAWTFIKKECANIGLGLPANSHSRESITAYLDKYVEKLGVKPLSRIMSAPVSIGGPLTSFETGKMIVAGEAAGCVMPLSGEGIRFGIYAGAIAHRPNYRDEFMKKYGANMETSRKILTLVRNLNDQERIDFLKCLDNPLEVLEGKLPKMGSFLLRPRLLLKLIHKRFL
jgi:digeranylgeranylglycerophospholipid reductase